MKNTLDINIQKSKENCGKLTKAPTDKLFWRVRVDLGSKVIKNSCLNYVLEAVSQETFLPSSQLVTFPLSQLESTDLPS